MQIPNTNRPKGAKKGHKMTRNANTPINANTIRFGVEIETIMPNTLDVYVGGYHSPVQVDFLPRGWKAGYDSSIRTKSGYKACEIVSPILSGADGLNQIVTVCKTLKDKGFLVNDSCGVHVSVDWGRQTSSVELSRLISATAYVEPAIYAITGTHKRQEGRFCHSIKSYGNPGSARHVASGDRYHLLNLCNLTRGQDRVEFRAFSGSLNEVKICGWVQVCVGLVQKAKTNRRRAKWDRKKNDEFTKKVFSNEATYDLFTLRRFLGWYPFQIRAGKSYGLIENSPIPREEIIAEFTRLVNAYNNETNH